MALHALGLRAARSPQRVCGGGFSSSQGKSLGSTLPKLAPGRMPIAVGSSESHGIAVTAVFKDSRGLQPFRTMRSTLYSLPDLKLAGTTLLSAEGSGPVGLGHA